MLWLWKNVIHFNRCWRSWSWQSSEVVCCWWHFWRCRSYCGSHATCSDAKEWYLSVSLFHLTFLSSDYMETYEATGVIDERNLTGMYFLEAVGSFVQYYTSFNMVVFIASSSSLCSVAKFALFESGLKSSASNQERYCLVNLRGLPRYASKKCLQCWLQHSPRYIYVSFSQQMVVRRWIEAEMVTWKWWRIFNGGKNSRKLSSWC